MGHRTSSPRNAARLGTPGCGIPVKNRRLFKKTVIAATKSHLQHDRSIEPLYMFKESMVGAVDKRSPPISMEFSLH